MSATIIHVFYDVPMGFSFDSLKATMHANVGRDELDKGEVAIFLNRSWMACKILTPGDMLLYYRSKVPLTTQAIKVLPTLIGAPRLAYGRATEAHMMKAFAEKFNAQMKALKVAHS
jgi:hypothetical protein